MPPSAEVLEAMRSVECVECECHVDAKYDICPVCCAPLERHLESPGSERRPDTGRTMSGLVLACMGILGASFAFGHRTIFLICLALMITGILTLAIGSIYHRARR